MVPQRLLPWLRMVFGMLAMAAMARQLVLQLQLGFSLVNFLSYFTNLSNLYAASVLLLGAGHAFARKVVRPNDSIRAAAVVYMAVVGMVFGLLLRDVDLGELRPWVNGVLHVVMPGIVVIDWLAAPPLTVLGARQVLQIMIFPAVYLGYVLTRGSLTGWYPYPFLNPAQAGGYLGVAGYVAGIAAAFFMTATLVRVVGNRRRIMANSGLTL